MNIVLLLFFLLFTSCAPDDETPPAPVATMGGSMTAATGETGDPTDTDPTANESVDPDGTGDLACEDQSVYECRGWIAGVYRRNGAGSGVFSNLPDIDNPGGPSRSYHECITNQTIVAPMIQPDNELLFARCIEECDDKADTYFFPEEIPIPSSTDTWELSHKECVFDDNGHNGYLFSENSGIATCPFIDATVPIQPEQQVLYVDMATPEDCATVDCSGWYPNGDISYSYNSGTKTHTTTIASGVMLDIYEGDWMQAYGCDTARWKQNINNSTGTETWSFQGLVSGDFLYRMGFRNGDHTVKVQRNIGGTAPIYTLFGPASFADIFDALHTYHNFKVTFRRPKTTSPYYDTHTMYLTL